MKYCKEIITKIASKIREGNTKENSALLCGISKQTYYEWLKDPKKVDFADAIKEAEAAFIESQISIIRASAMPRRGLDGRVVNGSWQASAWLLERMFSDQFAQKWQGELSGRGGKPLIPDQTPAVDTSRFTKEQLDKLVVATEVMMKAVQSKALETNGHTAGNGHT